MLKTATGIPQILDVWSREPIQENAENAGVWALVEGMDHISETQPRTRLGESPQSADFSPFGVRG